MAASTELNIARKNLAEALGDSFKLYLQNLKLWFKQKLSREDFDLESRRILTSDTVHLHNQFLLAVLTKCQSLSSVSSSRDVHSSSHGPSSKSRRASKVKKRAHSSRGSFQRFRPLQPFTPDPPG